MGFLQKVEAAYSNEYGLAQKSMYEMLKKFWPDYTGVMPHLKIVDNRMLKWTGLCKGFGKSSRIYIQRRLIEDKNTLDRVMTHELIHHMQNVNNSADDDPYGHGADFIDELGRINGIMGTRFVSLQGDKLDVIAPPKDYYVLIVKDKKVFGFSYSTLLSPSQKEFVSQSDGKLFKTNDPTFVKLLFKKSGSTALTLKDVTVKQRIGSNNYLWPDAGGAQIERDAAKKLIELYHSGKELNKVEQRKAA